MKERYSRRALLGLFLIMFACLFLSGGQRLIARQEDYPRPPIAPVLKGEAYLSNPLMISVESAKRHLLPNYGESQSENPLHSVQNRAQCRIVPGSDANGNVLGERSYMRAVYQAFALGDGFA